jgi:hypothetical protein
MSGGSWLRATILGVLCFLLLGAGLFVLSLTAFAESEGGEDTWIGYAIGGAAVVGSFACIGALLRPRSGRWNR